MSQSQYMLVPKISSYPGVKPKAAELLRWLVNNDIVEPVLSPCGRNGTLAYAMGAGAVKVLKADAEVAALLKHSRNGLEIVTERCVFTPEDESCVKARCPECRRLVSIALFERLEEWVSGETDTFICPHCEHEDDINGVEFTPGCAFSDVGLIFTNWPGEHFTQVFVRDLTDRFGFALAHVQAQYLEPAG